MSGRKTLFLPSLRVTPRHIAALAAIGDKLALSAPEVRRLCIRELAQALGVWPDVRKQSDNGKGGSDE